MSSAQPFSSACNYSFEATSNSAAAPRPVRAYTQRHWRDFTLGAIQRQYFFRRLVIAEGRSGRGVLMTRKSMPAAALTSARRRPSR